MPNVAQATITVTPVLQGAQQSLTEQMEQAADPAAQKAGQKAGKSMSQAIGDGMGKAGGALTKGVTAPLTAVGAAAVASWKEIDSGLDIIVQKTGASGEALDGMTDVFNNLSTTIPTDFETVGSAIGEVNTRFGLTGDKLEKLSGQFIKFAELNGTDVSSSVDSVQKALSAFGLSAEDAEGLLDTLNMTGQATGASVDTLAGGLVQNAKAFQDLGLNIDQATAFMGQMEVSGADSTTVMSGLRKALKNAAEDGIPLNDALSQLQDTIVNGKDGVDGLTEAYDLFGKSGDQIYNAVRNGSLDFTTLGDNALDASGNVSSAFEGTLDPMDEFTTTLNELKLLGADLVTAAGPLISDVVGGLSSGVKTLSEAWNGLSPEMQDTIIKIAGIAAVAGPLLAIGGKAIGGISSLVGGIGSLAGGLSNVAGSAVDAEAPVASAGGSIGTMAGQALKMVAAAAALWIAAQAISTLADAAIRVSSAGGPAIAVLAGMAVGIGALMGVAAACGPALTAGAVGIGVFGGALLAIGGGVNLASSGIAKVLGAVTNLTTTVSQNASGINSIVTNLGDTVNGTIDTVSNGVSNMAGSIGGAISGVLNSASGVIESVGTSAINAGTGFEKLAGALKDLTKNTGVADLAGTLGAAAIGIGKVTKAAGDAGSAATGVRQMSTAFKESANAAQSSTKVMATFGTAVKSSMTMAATSVRTANIGRAMATAMNNAYSSASNGLSRIKRLFSNTSFRFNHSISLPHFSMSGSFNAQTHSVPSVSVSWYAKAAEYGALFSNPQIIGVGDAAQPELLIGTEKLKKLVGGGTTINNFTFNVNGTDAPEQWADECVRQIKLKVRTT